MDILYTASQDLSAASQRRANASFSGCCDSPQMAETRGVPWDWTYLRSASAAEGIGWGVCGGKMEGWPPRWAPGLLRCMELLRGGGRDSRAGLTGSGATADGEMYAVSYEIWRWERKESRWTGG